MKKITLFFGLLFFAKFLANAQNKKINPKLDEKTIVKDSLGKILPYAEWYPKFVSGYYNLRSNSSILGDTTVFYIHRISKEQSEFNMSLVPKQQELKGSTNTSLTAVNNPLPPMPPESPSFKIGDKPTSFRANDIKGNRIKLKELQGKIVILNFWFIGCPPCRQEIPELNKIVEKYANNPNVVFVAIGLDDEYDIKEFLKTKPYNFQIIADGRMYADLYHVTLYPTTVILDKEGKVCFDTVSFGPSSPYWITKTIDGLL